ncbi:hypothetical protein CTA21_16220 [Salmonella enterica]|nr:hypothetical protein [Salmonella enterica]
MADTDPRLGSGRESILPPQVDDNGNSVITGKPPVSHLQASQNISDALWDAARTEPLDVDPKRGERGPTQQPDWKWQPNYDDGSLPYVTHVYDTPNGVIVPATQEIADAEFKKNMAEIWVPNKEDLNPEVKTGTPIQARPLPHGNALPVTQPEYGFPDDFGAVEPAVERPANTTGTLPHKDEAIIVPDYNWNPQRKIIAMGAAAVAKIDFSIGTSLNASMFFEKGVPTDTLVFLVDSDSATLEHGVLTAAKEGQVTLMAILKDFPQISATVTLTVPAPAP